MKCSPMGHHPIVTDETGAKHYPVESFDVDSSPCHVIVGKDGKAIALVPNGVDHEIYKPATEAQPDPVQTLIDSINSSPLSGAERLEKVEADWHRRERAMAQKAKGQHPTPKSSKSEKQPPSEKPSTPSSPEASGKLAQGAGGKSAVQSSAPTETEAEADDSNQPDDNG